MPEPMETVVLEKTMIKIGSLLALGFGDAGAEIIGQNMKGNESSALISMVPGRRVEAIFAFCSIRNFSDATEVLQDQVMVFVNHIASVIHSCINEFYGSPNMNTGDAFLVVWRLSGHTPKNQQKLADMALVSLTKIIANISTSPLLAQYKNHPQLAKRCANYRVRMGFGLHSGWAIEGVVGSEFKIDASYLSPNVNIAGKLELLTQEYGCSILMSHAMHVLMSREVAQECRLIDCVKVAGSKLAFKLHTIDLDDAALERPRSRNCPLVSAPPDHSHSMQRRKNELWTDGYQIHWLFERDADIRTMRRRYKDEFFCRFSMAYLNYEAGEWLVAKNTLNLTRFMSQKEDGPSAALLRFMRPYQWQAPEGWPGYRTFKEC